MLFLNELLTYLFKYIVLGIVAIAAVFCGAKYKRNKLKKDAAKDESVVAENEA